MNLFSDLDSTLELLAKALGAITALIAIVTALTQITLPAILRRREKWLRDAIERENNSHRKKFLGARLDDTTARILSGILVPGWRFVEPLWLMGLGALQYNLWQRDSSTIWTVLGAFAVAVVAVTTPLRRIIRLLCERARIAHEYREASREIQAPRLGLLSQMEGGTRTEFWHALLASIFLNLIAVGVVLNLMELHLAGLLTALVGLGGILAMWTAIGTYIRSRVTIFGPWSTDDPRY